MENEEKTLQYLRQCGERIQEPDRRAGKAGERHWNSIAKPLHGLGLLEDALIQIAAIQGTEDITLDKKAVVVMCADNGIIEEGVSQSGHEVTTVVTGNIAKGLASVNRMASCAGADVFPVDVGMKDDLKLKGLLVEKTRNGTRNFLKEPAMEDEDMLAAIRAGVEMTEMLSDGGYHILALGEMGIGNTTTSSAVASVLLGLPAEEVTGPGAGLDKEGVRRKIAVINQAAAAWKLGIHGPLSGDGEKDTQLMMQETLRTLRTVGGLDLCALTGACIGGAIYRVPIVLDGLITAVAALTACRLLPGVRDFLLPSHLGKEPAMAAIYEELKFCPVIHARLALGEGTGAVALFPLLDMACQVYRENATFGDLEMDAYEDYR
ncbi:nicotinate-nucleotide-dimethylbenzimidazole phosphoribosyltransferase [Lachnospiraceae bacterium NLAE-zl-G231]|nr:nicotinate-nucleotide-dimethylbenzimidazole phosphoribosyltransferase [Lachnospiraceae bacterium NLAE-zl-G231]